MYADNMGDSVIDRSSVIIHRVAQLEIHDFIHSCSLSTGNAETSCNSRKVPSMAGRACTIPMCYWDLLQGWCRRLVLPAWLPPVSSVPMWGLTGSAAAAACSHCCAHLWSVELKIQVAIEAGSDFSFSKTQMLATILKFYVEYSSVHVCVYCYLQYLLRSIKAKCLCQLCLFLFDNCWCHFTFVCESQPACCWVTKEGNR